MKNLTNKYLILSFTLFLAVILCGAVSATGSTVISYKLSVASTHVVNNEVSSTVYPIKIDSGVTYTKNFYGMKYRTKYYWNTYLYKSGMIVISTHFYHTTLKRTVYQKITIKRVWVSNYGMYMIAFSMYPKSSGKNGYDSLTSPNTTPLKYYWDSMGKGYGSFRSMMIKHAPDGGE